MGVTQSYPPKPLVQDKGKWLYCVLEIKFSKNCNAPVVISMLLAPKKDWTINLNNTASQKKMYGIVTNDLRKGQRRTEKKQVFRI